MRRLLERQRQFELMLERRQRLAKRPSDKRIRVLGLRARRAEVTWVMRRDEAVDDLADCLTRRQARRGPR